MVCASLNWFNKDQRKLFDTKEESLRFHHLHNGYKTSCTVCMSNIPNIDVKYFATKLQARAEKLVALSANAREIREPLELDQQRIGRLSRIDSMQVQAMAKEAERRRLAEIQSIKIALKRVAQGEYGDCINCGDPIAEARLMLVPTTLTCIECAS